jgi:2-polyprenyl-6-methoxyphenol hydroxylase-like FAD-dependent oxidoreductase
LYDVIVIGARVAGAATALLMARQGLRVLVVDRARFPSDTLSTHQVHLCGVACLRRWGLLDRLIKAGTPATRQLRYDARGLVLSGRFPQFEGGDALYSPRRLVLDKVLIDAARDAGAEVREAFAVDTVTTADRRVVRIRGRHAGGRMIEETARFIVGADGKHSLVAKTVGAHAYCERGRRSLAYYAYWDGLSTDGGQIFIRHRRAFGVWPTNDGLVVTFIAAPLEEFPAFRSNAEAKCMEALDMTGKFGAEVRSARRVGPFRGTSDLPNHFMKPYGPNWALVGDAGLVMDPITGQGISQALCDAELLSNAVACSYGGGRPLMPSLADYERRRNRRALPIFKFTTDVASFSSRHADEDILLKALVDKPDEIQRFFGVIAGIETFGQYCSLPHLLKVLGVRKLALAAAARMGLLFGQRTAG